MVELISWGEEFSVKVKEIDEQHKNLIKMINELYNAMTEGQGRKIIGKILKDMASYAQYHFKTEEDYMIKTNYPGYQEHKKEHDEFVKKVQKFMEDYEKGRIVLTIDVFFFLNDWLRGHILGTDKKFSKHFNEHGIY